MRKHIRTRVVGNHKQGWQVRFDNDAPVLVSVNGTYSGLTCNVCPEETCDHVRAVRDCGFYPNQLQLDELWLHSLPIITLPFRYTITRRTLGLVETLFLTDPRRYHADGRRGRITEVSLTKAGENGLAVLSTLYQICDRAQPHPDGGVNYTTEVVVPKATAIEVGRLIALNTDAASTHPAPERKAA